MFNFNLQPDMGRILAEVFISNFADPSKEIRCDAVVDTGASHLVLPSAWKSRLGEMECTGTVDLETADQRIIQGQIYGPVRIQVDHFRSVFQEVLFVDMEPQDGHYEPLLGCLPLEAIPVAVDMLGHRLVSLKALDAKTARANLNLDRQ